MRLPGRDDDAQIIVVAALLLAVLFVGLALVLNSAIYAENMATRGETSTSDAMATDGVTAERLGNAIDAANHQLDEDADYSDRRSMIRGNAEEWDRLMAQRKARDGRMFSTEPTAMTDGTRVNQSTRGEFMPADSSLLDGVTVAIFGDFRIDPLGLGDKKNWIVANDTRLRDFEMTVERESLYEKHPDTSTKIIETTNSVLTGSRLFWVEVDQNDASDEFTRVYLLNDTDNSSVEAVVVEFDDGTGTVQGRCRASGTDVTVRLTAGEMVGDDGVVECPALGAATGGHSREIYYAGADEVTGTYQFIADKPEAEFREELEDRYGLLLEGIVDALVDALLALLGGSLDDDDIYHGSPGDGDPYTTTAIYDATVETTYSDGRITYTRNVTYPPTAR